MVFDAHNVFPDGRTAVYRKVLYFRSPGELTVTLERAGFTEVMIDGGWHGQPLTSSSRLLVVRATK